MTRVYRAEDRADRRCTTVPLLDGTKKDAQAFVDRITRSAWWRRTCPPSWRGDETGLTPEFVHVDESKPPRRVIVRTHPREGASAYTMETRPYRGRWFPYISLGTACRAYGLPPAVCSPWVIVHELTHIICADSDPGHGPVFARTLVAAVRRWLGADAARLLREELKAEGMTLRQSGRAAKRSVR